MVETVKSSENKTEIVPLLERKRIKFPVQERKPLDFDKSGKPINPHENLPEAKSKLYYFGENETEEFVELQIIPGKPVGIVNVERADTEGGIKSIVGGFVDRDKNEIPGSGVTARREGEEEIGQKIGNNLISLGTWYTEGDIRNGRNKWIMANAFLYVETEENLNLRPSDEAKKVEVKVLDKEFLRGNFFAAHKKSVEMAIYALEERTGMVVDENGYLRLDIPDAVKQLLAADFPAASFEIADLFSGHWENTGPYQLQRIWKVCGGSLDVLAAEVARREFLADKLAQSDSPVNELLVNFGKYSVLFESLVDGQEGKFARMLRSSMPLLGIYGRDERSNLLATQDYPEAGPGIPGYDWSLLEKSLIRMSSTIPKLLEGKDFSSPVQALFTAAALHLDVSKGGTAYERSTWQREGINPFVHNEASYSLLARNKTFEKLIDLLDIPDLNSEEKELTSELFGKLIQYHGYIGQWVRGEITEFRIKGLTDWVETNKDKFEKLLPKLGVKENVSKFVSDLYYLINAADTASVREGLFTESLDKKFLEFRQLMEDVVSGRKTWDEIYKRLEKESTDKKREFLTERITKLRGGKDNEEVLGTFLELSDDRVNYIFNLLNHAQLWYVENATSDLSVENQIKLLTLAARIAREKGTDSIGNFDVNFAPLMNTLRPGRKPNRALTRIVDSMLYSLSWDEVERIPNENKIIANENLTIEVSGEHGITGINCSLKPEMVQACGLINSYYTVKREDSRAFKKAIENLNSWTGIKRDEWDRVFDQETYMVTMNSSMSKKLETIETVISKAKKEGKRIVFVGIGAGTGELEHAIAKKLDSNDLVIGTDISRAMVENMRRIARVLAAEKYLNPEARIAPMKAVLSDASTISKESLGIAEDSNTVTIFSTYSVIHEFASYVDNFKFGNFTERVYSNLMSKENFNVGDEVVVRDFIQEDPDEKITLVVGKPKEGELDPAIFIRNFSRDFAGFTDEERAEISEFPENPGAGTRIEVSKHLAMEIMGHYSWLKNAKNQKEMDERYGYFDAKGYKEWFVSLAEKLGIEVEIEIEASPAGYEDFIGGRMDAYDKKGHLIPVPLNMGRVVVRRVR